MGYNIGPTISVKGEEEYNASLKQIRQNMKYIKAEANNLTAAYDKNDKSVEAVTARVEGLKKAQEEQKKAVEAAKKALAEMTARGVDPASKAYRDMKANLDVAEAQLKTTTREIEAHERALANAKDGVADYGDAVDDASSKFSGFGEDGNELISMLDGKFGGIIGKISEVGEATSGVGAAMGLAFAGATTAVGFLIDKIAEIGKEMIEQANTVREQSIRMQAAFRISPEEAGEAMEIAKDLYMRDIVDSIEEASEIVSNVKSYLPDGEDLAAVSQYAAAIQFAFGVDSRESMKTAAIMARKFKISVEEAYDVLAATMSVSPSEASIISDTLQEFSVQFSSLGYTAQETGAIIAQSIDQGAQNVSKVGDAFKEAKVRIAEGGDEIINVLSGMGLNAQSIVDTINAGDAASALDIVIDKLGEVENATEQNRYGLAIFGTMWEDLGATDILALGTAVKTLEDVSGAIDDVAAKAESAGSSWDKFWRGFSDYFSDEGPRNYDPFHPPQTEGIIADLFKAIIGGIENTKSRATEDMERAGDDSVQGYIDGIEQATPRAEDAMHGFGASIKRAFTEEMGIRSPSKIMEYYAQMSVQGYVDEILAGKSDVMRAMSELAWAGQMSFANTTITPTINISSHGASAAEMERIAMYVNTRLGQVAR